MNISDFSDTSRFTKMVLISLGTALVLLLFIYYMFSINPKDSDKTVKLAIGEWSPYTGEDLEEYGIVTGLVTKIFHNMGRNPEYQFMPWPLAESISSLGENDEDIQGTFPYRETKPRKSFFYFSDTLINLENILFYNSINNPKAADIREIKDLTGQKIISIQGYDYPEEIKTFCDTQNVAKDNLEAFRQLENRKDPVLVVEVKEVGEQLLEQKLPNLVRYIRKAPLKIKVAYKLMLSRSNPNNLSLINEFNDNLRKFKSNINAYKSFQNAIKNKIDLKRAVMLEPFADQGVIIAYKDSSKQEEIYLPNGSKAIVEEWDPSFLYFRNSSEKAPATLVKIKLLNGPQSLSDSTLFIDGRSIHISN